MISAQRPESIRQMFDRISTRYDIANSILSFGTHRFWKKRCIHAAAQGLDGVSSLKILDCATGTGDLAEIWSNHLADKYPLASTEIYATDFSEGMLTQALKRYESRPKRFPIPVHFQRADIQKLDFKENEFDRITISFGIRNVANPAQGLAELGRVLKSRGELWVLEFGQPTGPMMSKLYRFYSGNILPRVGGWLSGQRDAYRYLNVSSERFPCGEEFVKLALQTKWFSDVRAFPLTGGIAFLYQLVRK